MLDAESADTAEPEVNATSGLSPGSPCSRPWRRITEPARGRRRSPPCKAPWCPGRSRQCRRPRASPCGRGPGTSRQLSASQIRTREMLRAEDRSQRATVLSVPATENYCQGIENTVCIYFPSVGAIRSNNLPNPIPEPACVECRECRMSRMVRKTL